MVRRRPPGSRFAGSGRLADGPLEPELGAVVGEDRVEVIEPGLGQRLDGLQDLDGAGGAGQLGALADVEEVELERVDGLDERLAGVLDLAGRGLAGLDRTRRRRRRPGSGSGYFSRLAISSSAARRRMMAKSVKPRFWSSQKRPTSASPRAPKLPKNASAPPPSPPPA